MGAAVDPETHARNRHFEPDPRAVERRLDIGREPIQLDRALHQPPDAEERRSGSERAASEPNQRSRWWAPRPTWRAARRCSGRRRRGGASRFRDHGRLRGLTGLEPPGECRRPRRRHAMKLLSHLSPDGDGLPRPADARRFSPSASRPGRRRSPRRKTSAAPPPPGAGARPLPADACLPRSSATARF